MSAESPIRNRTSLQVGNPVRPGSAVSPKKLSVYEERDTPFGSSPGGSARTGVKRVQKFCVDHLCVDNPDDAVLKEMFDFFDTDKSGQLDKNEFKVIFAQSFDNYGAPMSDKDINRMFEKLDRDGSGKLSYDEFCVLMLSRLKM